MFIYIMPANIYGQTILYVDAGHAPGGNGSILSGDMPLQLVYYSVQQVNKDALLQWTTEDEISTAYFGVERSTDGQRFEPIGRVSAVNTSGAHDYQFRDVAVEGLAGTLYYRLKQVDIDGKFRYTQVLPLSFIRNSDPLLFYPNPASGQATLYVTLLRPEQIQVHFMDNTGRVIKQSGYKLPAGASLLPFNLGGLSPGLYYVEVKGPGIEKQIKLIKQ